MVDWKKVGKGSLLGVFLTIVFYFVPGVNVIGPLLAGGITGYVIGGGFLAGLLMGVGMGIIMIIPGFILSGILGAMLSKIPILGAIAGGAGIILTIMLVIHTAALGTVGTMIGAMIKGSQKKE